MHLDSQLVDRVLALLREWGWETALSKLRAEIEAAHDQDSRLAREEVLNCLTAGGDRWVAAQEKLAAAAPALAAWAIFGQGFRALRDKEFERALQLLDEASKRNLAADPSLSATLALTRGAVLFHQGNIDPALSDLHRALELFGPDSFGGGRVLDALGMVYASRDNFQAAREFYEHALRCKQKFQDRAGVALTEGQLGRLYHDWGYPEKAEKHFQADLKLAQEMNDDRAQAQLWNHLGQVALERGDRAQAAARLDECLARCREKPWNVQEGFARKDRARLCLQEGKVAEAEEQAQKALVLFEEAGFEEGQAHLNRVWGMIRCAQGRHPDAEQCLREALRYFKDHSERAEVARTYLEIARTRKARGSAPARVKKALLKALESAEDCRRSVLVCEIEEELKSLEKAAHCRRLYRRVRGQGIRHDPTSLVSGIRETATVMFLDLKGYTEFTRATDPEVVMMTLNQMMAELAAILRRHGVQVNQYLGDGFMALVRESDHPVRAVEAALDLTAALGEFNRPRKVLGLREFQARIGISTGEVVLGNVGTYHKMDYTAFGTPTNLAARLQSEAEPGRPCVSKETHDAVGDRFQFHPARLVKPKGFDPCEVWDVAGRKP